MRLLKTGDKMFLQVLCRKAMIKTFHKYSWDIKNFSNPAFFLLLGRLERTYLGPGQGDGIKNIAFDELPCDEKYLDFSFDAYEDVH